MSPIPDSENAAEELFLPADDIEISRAAAQSLYSEGFMDVNPERWTRLREMVRFEDLVRILTGHHQMVISCPFHGRDSKPSFNIYRRTNDAFCFGCRPGSQYYDHVLFTSQLLGISRLEAMQWIEDRFDLPPMADVTREAYEDEHAEEFIGLTFPDVRPVFIDHAIKDAVQARDVDLAIEYLEILFEAWPTPAEEKENRDAGDPMPLARVLGKTTVDYLLSRKAPHAAGK